MPIVSVIIPVFNVEKYIRRCLDSIKKQTLSDIEIIVVNDGTPDNSMEIVSELAKDDHRIKILNHEKNMGLMWTRRTGYMAATGDYTTFCDSDDYLPNNALEKLYSAIVGSNADIISGNIIYLTVKGEELLWKSELKYGNSKEAVMRSLLRWELGHNLCGKLFKTSLLQNYDYKTYMHVTNGEDGCLFYQVVGNMNRMALINDVVYYYIQNMESSTQVRLSENAIKSICILNKVRDAAASSYPKLHTDLSRCVTNILCGLYIQGYNKGNTNLIKHITENGLNNYITLSNIIRYLNYLKIMKLFIRYKLLNIQ